MVLKESFESAISSIKANALRSFLTSLAIIIGTAAVIAVIGIGNSANKALDAEIDELGVRNISIFAGQKRRGGVNSGTSPLTLKDAYALEKVTEHNWMVAPGIERGRQVQYKNNNMQARINGYSVNNFPVRGFNIEYGRFFSEKENLSRKKVVVIGSKVPAELKSFGRTMLNQDILIGGASYEVIGILSEEGASGWQSPDDELYIPILTATSRIAGTEDLGWINVGIPNDANVDYVMMSIEEVLRRQHDIGPGENNDFRINDWSQYSDFRREATNIFALLIAGIAGISLIVGGIGVMNIMLVSVTERTREIGLRKALGATPNIILFQFLVEATILCMIGGVIGVFIGTSLLYLFAAFNDWPFAMPISAIFGSITFSALVGLTFGIWPARRAAKLDPAVSLRYE